MNKKIYELIEEDFYKDEQHINTYLFNDRGQALAKLKKLREKFISENDLDNYNIDIDDEDEFDVYEKGFYDTNRYVLYITEKEIL